MNVVAIHPPPLFVRAHRDFQSASRVLFEALGAQTGLPSWAMYRLVNGECMVVATNDKAFNLRPGIAMAWDATISARVIAGHMPQVIPDVHKVPALADAYISHSVGVRAHLCVPMQLSDQEIGCLVGLDTQAHGDALTAALPLATTAAGVLATLWAFEMRLVETHRNAERVKLEAMTDPLTGAYNRRGWQRIVRLEQSRCRRTRATAGVIMLDLDYLKPVNDEQGHDAGDRLIVRTAEVVRQSIRDNDALARLGGDEFAILLPDMTPSELMQTSIRLKEALRQENISATFGSGWSGEAADLRKAQDDADAVLIQAKSLRGPNSARRG